VEQLEQMTWRRFLVLLNNLSPYGAVATQIRALKEKHESTPEADETAANAFFSSIVSR